MEVPFNCKEAYDTGRPLHNTLPFSSKMLSCCASATSTVKAIKRKGNNAFMPIIYAFLWRNLTF